MGQSELIPCHAAQIVWKDRMIGRRIFLYTDYEAARYGLIKSTSPTQNKRLDRQTSTDPRKRPTRPTRGLRRVPSASNCADGPSRNRFEILTDLGIKARKIELPRGYEEELVKQWKWKRKEPRPRPELASSRVRVRKKKAT